MGGRPARLYPPAPVVCPTAHPPGSLALRATAWVSELEWLIWALCVTLASDSPGAQSRSGQDPSWRHVLRQSGDLRRTRNSPTCGNVIVDLEIPDNPGLPKGPVLPAGGGRVPVRAGRREAGQAP